MNVLHRNMYLRTEWFRVFELRFFWLVAWLVGLLGFFGFFSFLFKKLGLVKHIENIRAPNMYLNPKKNCSAFLAIFKQFSELSNTYDYAILKETAGKHW